MKPKDITTKSQMDDDYTRALDAIERIDMSGGTLDFSRDILFQDAMFDECEEWEDD